MEDKILFVQGQSESFVFDLNGARCIMSREYGVLPSGNVAGGAWVIRNMSSGEYVDSSCFQNDLFDKYNMMNARYAKSLKSN